MKQEISNLLTPEFLADFCRRYQIEELAVFGSALRDDFRSDSDVDFLVTYAPDKRYAGWFDMPEEDEMAERLGRKVDWLTKETVEKDHNPRFRRSILNTFEVIYALA